MITIPLPPKVHQSQISDSPFVLQARFGKNTLLGDALNLGIHQSAGRWESDQSARDVNPAGGSKHVDRLVIWRLFVEVPVRLPVLTGLTLALTLSATACGSSPHATGRVAATQDAVGGVTAADLLNAPVPAECQHPAGRMVNGVQTGVPADQGSTTLRWAGQSKDVQAMLVAVGDLTGDGVPDAATVLSCNAGGVSWPDIIAFYTKGPALLGTVELDKVNEPGAEPGENDLVDQLSYANGAVTARWSTEQDDDAACCGTLDYSATFRWTGSTITWSGLTGHTEVPSATAFAKAIAANDTSTATKLSSMRVVSDATALAAEMPHAFEQMMTCKSLNEFDLPNPVFGLIDPGFGPHAGDTSRVCFLTLGPSFGSDYLVLGLWRSGWSAWTVRWVAPA